MTICGSQLELGNFHKRDGNNHLNQEKEAKVSLPGRTADVMVDGGSKISEKIAKLSVVDEEHCRDTDAVVDFKGNTSEIPAKRGRVSANLESHADSIDVNGKTSQIRAKGRRRNPDGIDDESLKEAIRKIAPKCICRHNKTERNNKTLHDLFFAAQKYLYTERLEPPSMLGEVKTSQPLDPPSMLGEVKKSQPLDPPAFVMPFEFNDDDFLDDEKMKERSRHRYSSINDIWGLDWDSED